jgi:RND family efflux transporter MFP subunit
MSVGAGQPLFYLDGGDVTDNDAAVKFAEAESNYELAKADYERKKTLFIDKIVSEREYQAAEVAYRQAEARFESMKRNFGEGKVTLKSSMDGCVATLLVANGDYVEPGKPLAVVQRGGGVNLVAELPVRYAAQLQDISTVNIETAQGDVYNMNDFDGHAVVGSVANECNMLPVTVSCNALPGVVTGSIVTLYISSMSDDVHHVAVPRTALVEEMGNMFVFVQNNPVSFEKRSVKVGATDGRYVQLLDGVAPGERVVSKGGVILKLSQGAAALDPHAGHVH